MTIIRTYSELMSLPTFEERFEYLKLSAKVGNQTFSGHRYLNQEFYRSPEWKSTRNKIIIRDDANDLADPNYPIQGRVYIHHLNPLTIEDIQNMSRRIFDPENLVCVSFDTHNAIHYSDADLLRKAPIVRTRNDTCPWR